MKNWERKIIEFGEKHYLLLSFIFITLIAFIMRYSMRNYESGDFYYALNPWFNYLKEHGSLKALATYPGDYNAPYVTLLALLTYLPFNSLFLIKGLSIIFDFLMALAAALLVKELSNHNKFLELITYFIVLIIPTVLLNSGMWGQCDSIFIFFSILSLYFLIKEKYSLSFIMLGISFAFKLQFIFILPVYIILYVSKKKFSIFNFFLIPLMDIVLSLPAVIMGMPFKKIFTVYFEQSLLYKDNLNLNFFNIYNLIGNSNQTIFYRLGTLLTLTICFLVLIYCINKKIKWNNEKIITLSLWFMVMIPFILPGMHERYLYGAEVLVVIYYLIYKKNLYLLIYLLLAPILTYSHYLNGLMIENAQLISIIYGIILIYFTKYILELLKE